ncbi:hypothetical protein N7474_000373 [Penicillium riverlandense]|uniref:uncharacterized protein n=1 Tax=Penicillium riverlandense TaxID=1903569 RepID=UPI002548FF4C|nr:uncharacterized protein N7474_000373 [Penicillium riverlandense]KAJ5832062.1 hypothetical protein N7474_000373 [Penicillium riverlandense]
MSLHDSFPAYGGRGPGDVRLGIALGAVATLFIFLRVYVRLRINKFGTTALMWALLAWGFTAMTQIFGILSVLHGLGNHMTVVAETGELHNFLLFTWITVFFFNLAIPTGKVAVAAFLMEMNQQTNPKIRKSLIILAAVNIVVNIPQILLIWFQCSPVDALWDPLRQTECDHRKSVYYTYFVGAVAAFSDFYLAIIPIHMLLPLRIDRKLKWGLSFLMGCGVFAGVAAIVRTWAAKFILSEDSSYGVGVLFRWGEVEEWVVLISMSIPPVWPLFRPLTQRFIKTTSSRSHPQLYYSNYKQYASTTDPCSPASPGFPPSPRFPTSPRSPTSPGLAPPMVTTTISVSSMAKEQTTSVPSRSISRISHSHTNCSDEGDLLSEREHDHRIPSPVSADNRVEDGWMELQGVKGAREDV